jgi:TRAP-type C4-dicarboxylate transport system permease small subunit
MAEKQEKVGIEEAISAFLLAVLTVLLFIQIIARYFFGTGVDWSEELSRYFFVWSTYFGCAVAAKGDKHIRVTAQLMFLSERQKAWLISVSDILWVAFCVLLFVFGFRYVASMFEYPFSSPSMKFNLAWVYAIVPLSYALMCVHVVVLIVSRIRKLLAKQNVEIADSRMN